MMGNDELKLLITVANDFIKTLPESAAFSVAAQVKIAIGNLEAYLKVASDAQPKAEDATE